MICPILSGSAMLCFITLSFLPDSVKQHIIDILTYLRREINEKTHNRNPASQYPCRLQDRFVSVIITINYVSFRRTGMFSTGHFFFILLSTAAILAGVAACKKIQPPIRKLLIVCLCLGLLSEVSKILGSIEIVPVVEPAVENGVLLYRETGAYTPYLEAEHLPFELCSLQILFMLFALLLRNPTWRKRLYALMYTTCIVGAGMAILFSSEAP